MSGLYENTGKLSRRLGVGITPKGQRILARRPNPPGQHGAAYKNKKISEYALQLKEKQKLRAFYGLRENQFRKLFEKAQRMKGLTGDNLLILLERRLDNVVYRQGLAISRRQARQLVSHGHFAVNGVPTDIPSYTVSPGETISVVEASRNLSYFKNIDMAQVFRNNKAPDWFSRGDQNGVSWSILSLPNRDHAEPEVEVQMIVEFYSR